jgi:hypothetical protein
MQPPFRSDEERQHRQKHIINVSAMEGKFTAFKEDRHPHTNMAKAALNMLTPAAGNFGKTEFYECSRYGLGNRRRSCRISKRKQEEQDFQPPLDIVDGAARVMDPLFDGINTGKTLVRQVLKITIR